MTRELHEPLSWLLLERYALGELPPSERARVEARIATSSADRACLEAILSDTSELPPLPMPLPARERRGARGNLRRASYLTTALAAAAAVLLLVLRSDAPLDVPATGGGSVKGGDVSLTLHGELHGADALKFGEGERFKLFVTCPPDTHARFDVVVFQAGEQFRPLASPSELACGNQVPWPGAFTLTGNQPVEVCVSVSPVPASAREGAVLGAQARCTLLTPALHEP